MILSPSTWWAELLEFVSRTYRFCKYFELNQSQRLSWRNLLRREHSLLLSLCEYTKNTSTINEKKEDNVPQLLGFLSNYNKIFTNQKAERKDLRYQDVRLWLFCMSPLKLHFLISCLVFLFLFFRIARFFLSSPANDLQWFAQTEGLQKANQLNNSAITFQENITHIEYPIEFFPSP